MLLTWLQWSVADERRSRLDALAGVFGIRNHLLMGWALLGRRLIFNISLLSSRLHHVAIDFGSTQHTRHSNIKLIVRFLISSNSSPCCCHACVLYPQQIQKTCSLSANIHLSCTIVKNGYTFCSDGPWWYQLYCPTYTIPDKGLGRTQEWRARVCI